MSGLHIINPIWNAEIFCITQNELQISDSRMRFATYASQKYDWEICPQLSSQYSIASDSYNELSFSLILQWYLCLFPNVEIFFSSTSHSTYVTTYTECSKQRQSEMIVSLSKTEYFFAVCENNENLVLFFICFSFFCIWKIAKLCFNFFYKKLWGIELIHQSCFIWEWISRSRFIIEVLMRH